MAHGTELGYTGQMRMKTSFSLGFGQLGTLPFSAETLLCATAIGALVFVPAVGSLAAALYILSGLLLMALHPVTIITTMIRQWYLLLLPVFCTLSFIWSNYPGLTFRAGLQLTVTIVIAMTIARLMPPRKFCLALFIMLGASMFISVASGTVRSDIGAWIGIYGSKNAFAGAAALFTVFAFAMAIDNLRPVYFRMLSLVACLMGFFLVLSAQSVSALAIIPPTLITMLLIRYLPRFTPYQRVVIIAFTLVAATLVGLLVAINFQALMATMLEATGKDLTLTGRTDLWKIAWGFIQERPLLGLGFQAFWVKGYAPAEAIWMMFGIDGRGGFNFHNMYFSNAVEIGLIGLAIQIFVIFGAAVLTWRWSLKTGEPAAGLLFALHILVIMVTFVEVPLFLQFSLRTMLVFCTFAYGVYGIKGAKHPAD